MTVVITWSTTNGGLAMDDLVNHGEGSSGALDSQEIFIRHDGIDNLTNCKFYLAAIAGYSGDRTAAEDLAEMLAWGDGIAEGGPAIATEFGGFQLNMDATGEYGVAWPSFGDEGDNGDAAIVCRTGLGDSQANGIILNINMGLPANGVLPTGDAPNVRFKIRIAIPEDESGVGVRQVDQRLSYTYTS